MRSPAAQAALLAAFGLATACSPAPAGAPGSGLVVVGATVFDGSGGAPLPDAFVVVEGDRIKAVGPQTHVPLPKGVPVLDARGKFVVPYLDAARAAEAASGGARSQTPANLLARLWTDAGVALSQGRPADFLILDADPRIDLANLSRVYRTVRGGRVVTTASASP